MLTYGWGTGLNLPVNLEQMEKSTVVIYSRGIYLNPKTPDSYSEVSADRLSLLKSAQAQNEIIHKDFFICVTCYFCKIRKYLFFLCP